MYILLLTYQAGFPGKKSAIRYNRENMVKVLGLINILSKEKVALGSR
jgi:hypothetical protein